MVEKNNFVCPVCGRCYQISGVDLTKAGEERMHEMRKSWNRHVEEWLCCEVNFDKWRIKMQIEGGRGSPE